MGDDEWGPVVTVQGDERNSKGGSVGRGRARWRCASLLAAGLILATACGTAPGTTGTTGSAGSTPGSTPGTALDATPAALPLCADVARLGPVRESNKPGNENPDIGLMNVLQTYESAHEATFAGQWIDRDHGGTIVLAFTDDSASHLAEILARRPSPDDQSLTAPAASPTTGANGATAVPSTAITGTTTVGDSGWTIDVVQASQPLAELQRVQESLAGDLGVPGVSRSSVGVDIEINHTALAIDPSDLATRRLLGARWRADQVCVEPAGPAEGPVDTWPAGVPKPTSLIPAEGSDPYITCGTGPLSFPASNLQHHVPIADDDPLLIAFRASAGTPTGVPAPDPSTAYLLARTDTKALFASGPTAAGLTTFELHNGRWIWTGSGGSCDHPHALAPPGLGEVDWTIDGAFPPPGPADTIVHVLLAERACTGGAPIADRLTGPEVVTRPEQILIAFATTPPVGRAFSCIGSPPTPTVVTLPEPLGARVLADGSFVPPQGATTSGPYPTAPH